MGHGSGHIYRKLGEKVDSLALRSPWNDTFHDILKELYTAEEAEVVVRMPYSMSDLERVRKATGYEEARLKKVLEGLCSKGLVIDIFVDGGYYYAPSPMVVGIFEFTMMRTDGGVDHRKMARLFSDYMHGAFFGENFKPGEMVSLMRTLPHEAAVEEERHVEVLDHERAASLIGEADRFSIGICSCRHERLHMGEKSCNTPLETCSSFGIAADYLIRNRLAKEVSKTEMLENFARSKEMGLVLCADNVRRNVTYVCHCCGCCCNVLLGITRHGYTSTIVTSGFVPRASGEQCEGCGKCAKACPIGALEMVPAPDAKSKIKKRPRTDESTCLGCGVCALKCRTGALRLVRGGKKAIYPESTFERVILQSLEKGTLQYQLFDDPNRVTHRFIGGLVGGFLRLPPVKRALMSDVLRSVFLGSLKAGIKMQGKGWVLKM